MGLFKPQKAMVGTDTGAASSDEKKGASPDGGPGGGADGAGGAGGGGHDEKKDAPEVKDAEVKEELENRHENLMKKTPFCVFPLRRGRAIGSNYTALRMLDWSGATAVQITAKLKVSGL
jgi:hypothetical protein